jgi:hypothetical protein
MNSSQRRLALASVVAMLAIFPPWAMASLLVHSVAVPKQAPAATSIYSDDFSDPDSGWPQYTDADTTATYLNGEYRFFVQQSATASWVTGSPFFADLDVQVQARATRGGQDKSYGLLFGMQNIDTFHDFEIDPVQGNFALRSHSASGWTTILDWTPSTAIKRDAASNQLGIVRKGTSVTLYANGVRLAGVTLPGITAGRLGFLVANYADPAGADIFFDSLTVYRADERSLGTSVANLPLALRGPLAGVGPVPTALPLPAGIHGRVTVHTEPAAGITVTLRQYDAAGSAFVAMATTDATGLYHFASVPDLQADKIYFVLFGPNRTNPRRVFAWYGPDITSYRKGASQPGGDFDVGDIVGYKPTANAALKPPATFRWFPRPVSDTYRLRLFEPAGSSAWTSDDLGHVGQATINLPAGANFGTVYGWTVRAFDGPTSFGDAYYYSPFTFSRTAATWPNLDPNHGIFSASTRSDDAASPKEALARRMTAAWLGPRQR